MAKAVKRNFLCMSAQREACVRDRIFRRREDDTTCSYGLLPQTGTQRADQSAAAILRAMA